MNKELLEIRKKAKAKKPEFNSQDIHKKPRINKSWRRPTGIDSKIRQRLNGYRKMPSQGYRSPKSIRGLDRSGFIIKIINSIKELSLINKKTEGIIISSKLGQKKKIEILKKAKELDVSVLNIKDIDQFIKEKEEAFKLKKESKKKKIEQRNTKEKESKEKENKEKENLSKKVSDEEQKDKEKKDKDKLLTKKEK